MKTTQISDIEFLDAIKVGNNSAFSAFYRMHEQKFKSDISSRFGNNDEDFLAEVFQDALIRLWENIEKGKLTAANLTSSLYAYLICIGKNVAMEWFRKEGRYVPLETGDDIGDDDDTLGDIMAEEENELTKAIREAVYAMNKPCAPLLLSFYWDRKSWREIAIELGYSGADSAKTQKNKCMSKLKGLFRK